MKLSPDKQSLQVNESLTLAGIPPETFDYRLGSRSALDWIIDQYQVKGDSDTPTAKTISYIVRLVGQVVRVSIETQRIVTTLPRLSLAGRLRDTRPTRPPAPHRLKSPHPHHHFNLRTQPVNDRHKPVNRKPPQVRISDAGKIRRRNPGPKMGGAQSQSLPVEHLDDLSRQDGLELFNIGILVSQIAKHVAASANHVRPFNSHRNISFNILIRSLIRTISR